MAKGNMLLGYSRGSVGDVVFYRDGGLQRTRARNRNPRNPKSSKQMLQRSLLANCVKFYKIATKGLYKFGFENKKYNESDYNAFVRVNIKRGVNISKTAFDTPWYGAIGYWRMTEGSLNGPTNVVDSSKAYFDFGVQPSESVPATPTIGWLSSQLINGNPSRYMAGDIFTYCVYTAEVPQNGMPSVSPVRGSGFPGKFTLSQFRINTADEREVNDVLQVTGYVATVNGNLAIGYGQDSATAAEDWALGLTSACLIISRNTAEGTKVSTTDLLGNTAWNTAVEACKDTDYISAVLADWQAGGEAILQGGASEDYENPFDLATAMQIYATVATDNDLTDEEEITATNGVLSVPMGKNYLHSVTVVYDFANAEDTAQAFAAIKGEGSPTKDISTYGILFGSSSVTFSVATATVSENEITLIFTAETSAEEFEMTSENTLQIFAGPARSSVEVDFVNPFEFASTLERMMLMNTSNSLNQQTVGYSQSNADLHATVNISNINANYKYIDTVYAKYMFDTEAKAQAAFDSIPHTTHQGHYYPNTGRVYVNDVQLSSGQIEMSLTHIGNEWEVAVFWVKATPRTELHANDQVKLVWANDGEINMICNFAS